MAAPTLVPFGATGMLVSRVGLGTAAAGGAGGVWGPQEDSDSVATILRALETGVNWLDTAPNYGWGHAEEVVGKALRALPAADRPYVFSKCGAERRDEEIWSRGDPAFVRADVEASLHRLGLERLDLLQLHFPLEDGTALADCWSTLLSLREEGKAAHIGLCNQDVGGLEEAQAVGPVEALQTSFSAIARDAAGDLLPWCARHRTAVTVYWAIHGGLLTGGFSRSRLAGLPVEDWRRRYPDFNEELERNLAIADCLESVAARHEVSTAAAAIAWTLAFEGVTAAVVGARRPDQVDDWAAALELTLDSEDLDAVAAVILEVGAGSGPIHP